MRVKFWILFCVLIPLAAYALKFGFWGGVFAFIVGCLFVLGVIDIFQKKQTIRRNYPLLGRVRYVFEELRPKIYQYFIESDLDGRPINRIKRSVVYQRAKKMRDTVPFGTQLDVYDIGYEWINHSLNALEYNDIDKDPRVLVGGNQCTKPYSASILNISAMSYGALSKNAVMALNKGAKIGGFAHNTGEGGVSDYHLEESGDLIWQIGTGYFGCRDLEGNFSEENFVKNATKESIKMIEIKLSQGAKPGHGGILPAVKNNEEIARIRGIRPWESVVSPPKHKAFSGNRELCEFIAKLRKLSGGKPVGLKFCLGQRGEFIRLCREMVEQGIYPDYIAVDGGEGGTGAAPLEFTDRIGTPLIDALVFVHDVLVGLDIRDNVKIFASGKSFTGFDLVRFLSLGADAVYSARAMMVALGCIQALECNANTCPTGITTHKKDLVAGLDVGDKGERVASYHKQTVHAFSEMIGAAGIVNHESLNRSLIFRRISNTEVKRYDQLYPKVTPGVLLTDDIPENLKLYFL